MVTITIGKGSMRRLGILLVMAVLFVAACTDTDTTVTSTAEPHVGTGIWNRVPHDETILGGTGSRMMPAVTAGDPGLAVVGYDGLGSALDAAVWFSDDGLTWTQVPHNEEAFGGGGDQEMYAVVSAGPGLVAVAYDSSGDDWDAAVWYWTSG